MKNIILKLFLLCYFSNLIFGQSTSGNEYFRLSFSGGISRHFFDFGEYTNWSRNITLGYLEYGLGFMFHPMHEVGIKMGCNDYPTSQFNIGYRTLGQDTILLFYYTYIYESANWFSVYYRFNFRLWYAELNIGSTMEFQKGYTGFSLGRDFKLTDKLNAAVGLKYASRGKTVFDFVNSENKHLILTVGAAFKF